MFYVRHLEDRELTCIVSEDIVKCVEHWAGVVKGRRLNTHISPILKLFLGDCSVLCVLCPGSGCRLYWQCKHWPRPGDTSPPPRRSPAVSHTRPPAARRVTRHAVTLLPGARTMPNCGLATVACAPYPDYALLLDTAPPPASPASTH